MKYCDDVIIKKIDEYISLNKNKIVDDLLELVRVPSVKGEAKPDAPFGEKCAEMLDKTALLFEYNGFKTDINHIDGYALSYYGEGDKSIGLFAHTDVVPVDDKWQVCKPFEPVVKEGYIFGRGCNDDKSGVIETLYAAKIIRDLGLDFNSKLVMFSGSNEESGMEDISAFAAKEQMPDVSLVPDAMYPCICGERSMIKFDIVSKNKTTTIKKFHGGEAFNIVLGELNAELVYSDELWMQISNVCGNNENFVISKDADTIYITSKGVAKHVMDAETAVNAAMVMADMLAKCPAIGDNDAKLLNDISSYLKDCYGTGFGIAHNDDIFGKLVCANGIVRLTENGNIKLTFDCRIGLSYDLEDVKRQIHISCGDAWTVENADGSIGYNMDDDAPAKRVLEDVYASISGIDGVQGYRIAAGTYARKLKNAYPIGTVAYYKAEPYPMPEGHGGIHQPDEMMSIDAFLEAIKILVCLLLELDKLIN
ncbi:MAG: Sapep family Mn(2+)-dependent dipeptidase [Clostridia bacterium]|nr:Sapep family Mn(2+)-dependent dipeptidase [Clostridia bacterium]